MRLRVLRRVLAAGKSFLQSQSLLELGDPYAHLRGLILQRPYLLLKRPHEPIIGLRDRLYLPVPAVHLVATTLCTRGHFGSHDGRYCSDSGRDDRDELRLPVHGLGLRRSVLIFDELPIDHL